MKTIHLLPISEPKHSAKDFRKAFEEKLLIAASLDYIPDSLETLKAIDYIDLKLLMKYNKKFYAAAVELCGDIIQQMIKDALKPSRRKSVKTLDDFLNCGYYGDDYETSRHEFINVLSEDYLTGF